MVPKNPCWKCEKSACAQPSTSHCAASVKLPTVEACGQLWSHAELQQQAGESERDKREARRAAQAEHELDVMVSASQPSCVAVVYNRMQFPKKYSSVVAMLS